jgi:predicted patatin/cPLA2 family phospholipase
MKLTIEQILERWQDYTSYTQKIQQLKDLLLDLKTVYSPEDLDLSEKKLNKVIAEIKYTYKECMLPIIKDIISHIDEYREIIQDILRKEKDESVIKEMDDFLIDLKLQIQAVELSALSVDDLKADNSNNENS